MQAITQTADDCMYILVSDHTTSETSSSKQNAKK